MNEKTKMVPAQLIKIDAAFIHEAVDHLTMTNGGNVVFQVINGICVGIDTEKRISLPAPPSPVGSTALKALTESMVYKVIREAGKSLTARDVGDALGFARTDTALRGKVSRLLAKLKTKGEIASPKNHNNHYMIKVAIAKAKTPATRIEITEEKVLTILRTGAFPTKLIGDKLGIPRGDAAVRAKIGLVIRILKQSGTVQTDNMSEGQPVYKLVEATAAA